MYYQTDAWSRLNVRSFCLNGSSNNHGLNTKNAIFHVSVNGGQNMNMLLKWTDSP